MAFALRNLSVLAYANGFTLWHYKALNEDRSALGRSDYFRSAGDMLSAGDVVIVSSAEAGRVLCVTQEQGGLSTVPFG